jgi:PQQ-dependent catabolism-associated CXXCW motif protein
MEQYRAPVPATLNGATVLDTAGLRALMETGKPILIDVLPKARKPKDRDAGQLWVEPPREALPGSVWLPNVGYGELAPEFRQYLEEGLAELSGGDKARPLVFYCDANCWMSWNAAKRARHELGYTQVYWYPEGVQGWKTAGLPVEAPRERPMPGWSD